MWRDNTQARTSVNVQTHFLSEACGGQTHFFLESTIFGDRDWELPPMAPEVLAFMNINQPYYSLEPTLSDARSAFPQFEDILVKVTKIAAFLNAEPGLPADDTDYLPSGHLSKADFLNLTATARDCRFSER